MVYGYGLWCIYMDYGLWRMTYDLWITADGLRVMNHD